MERASTDFGRHFRHGISIDSTFLTVTDYTQLRPICGPVECVMPVSLYSQQSCNFVNMITPVLVTQNASILIIIIITNVP